MRHTRLATRRWLGAAAMALPLACGGGAEDSETTGASMALAAADAPADEAVALLNERPVVERVRLSPSRPRPGQQIAADADVTDPDGDPVQLRYVWRVDGALSDQTARSFHVESGRKGARIEVEVFARDAEGEGLSERASARIGNQPPVLLGVVIEPLDQVRAGQDVAASPRATDPDGDEIEYRYTWKVNGRIVPEEGAVLAASHFGIGDEIRLSVVATDGQGDSERIESSGIPVVNAAPRITSTPAGFDADGVFRYRVAATDSDGNTRFRYRLLEGPEGMEVDVVDGLLEWEPREGQEGVHPVKVQVSDMKGGSSEQRFEVSVSFEETPPPASPEP